MMLANHTKKAVPTLASYKLNRTPSETTRLDPTGGKSSWNEIVSAPVSYDSKGQLSAIEVIGFFVYTSEKNATKWPDNLKVFYELALANKMPLVILWNQFSGTQPDG